MERSCERLGWHAERRPTDTERNTAIATRIHKHIKYQMVGDKKILFAQKSYMRRAFNWRTPCPAAATDTSVCLRVGRAKETISQNN